MTLKGLPSWNIIFIQAKIGFCHSHVYWQFYAKFHWNLFSSFFVIGPETDRQTNKQKTPYLCNSYVRLGSINKARLKELTFVINSAPQLGICIFMHAALFIQCIYFVYMVIRCLLDNINRYLEGDLETIIINFVSNPMLLEHKSELCYCKIYKTGKHKCMWFLIYL